eukprot:TRINITY_DN40131_c0_g1_i1.p1 TRINITY_DN40131_c0_g1~~TRINITY_DN40131_c0_g1_i1.p1  ORF type:complete len:473 (+),score=130.10 TRINITY_DN40131_c0_g1_i1:79-1497(+)
MRRASHYPARAPGFCSAMLWGAGAAGVSLCILCTGVWAGATSQVPRPLRGLLPNTDVRRRAAASVAQHFGKERNRLIGEGTALRRQLDEARRQLDEARRQLDEARRQRAVAQNVSKTAAPQRDAPARPGDWSWTGIGSGSVRAAPLRLRPAIEVVVSRHSGNLSWAADVDGVCDVMTVYDKSGAATPPAACRNAPTTPLPNYGREGHSFLHHILSRWESLAEWTVFTQDDPLPHAPHFVPLLRTFLWDASYFRPFQTLSVFGRVGQPPASYPPRYRTDWVGNCSAYLETADQNLWPMWPDHEVYRALWRDRDYRRINALYRARFLVPDGVSVTTDVWSRFVLPGVPPQPFVYSYSGVFAVRRDRIRAVPRQTYLRLLRAVELEPPKWPLLFTTIVLERLWAALFGGRRGEREPKPPPAAAPPGTCFGDVKERCCDGAAAHNEYDRAWLRRHPPREWSQVRDLIKLTQSASCC